MDRHIAVDNRGAIRHREVMSPDTTLRHSGRGIRRLALGSAAVSLGIAAMFYTFLPFSSDHGYYSYGAWRITQGDVPYRDVGCYDAPGIYAVHLVAHSVFGWDPAGFRRFDVLWTAMSLVISFVIVRRVAGRGAAWLAVAITGLLYVGFGYRETGQRETLTLPFILLLLLLHLRDRRGTGAWLAMGASVAAVFWLKPPVVLACVPVIAIELWGARGRSMLLLQRVAAIVSGVALVSLPVLAYFAAQGALRPLRECFVDYSAVYATVRYPVSTVLLFLTGILLQSPIAITGIVGIALLRRIEVMALIGVCALGAAASAALQAKLVTVHFVPMWFLLSLAASITLAWPWARAEAVPVTRRKVLRVLSAFMATAVVIEIAQLHTRAGHPRLLAQLIAGRGSMHIQREEERIARYLTNHTQPDDAILVWGVAAGSIYFLAQRPSPSRFLQVQPFTSELRETALVQGWKQEYLDSVRAVRPRYIVVMSKDAFPGIRTYDSEVALREWTELAQWIDANYREETLLEGRFRYRVLRLAESSPVSGAHE